jgi:NAD+ synthase (glutamine-hydrolysing)
MTAAASVRIALAQLDLLVGDIHGNTHRVLEAAERAREEYGAQVVVYPELTLTSYPPEDLLLRPGLYEHIERALIELQTRLRGIDIVVGYPALRDGHRYNVAGYLRPGRPLIEYRKQILPNYSVFDEMRYFVPSADSTLVRLGDLEVGLSICEDIWQPGPVNQAVEAGARLILNLNASPFHQGKYREREAVLRARVQECGVPMVYVNLVGGQDELVFDGHSMVVDAGGHVVQRAAEFREEMAVVDVHADGAISAVTTPAVPADDLESIYTALVKGVRDYVNKNGFAGAILGLSGGIDSALALAIAVDALGAQRVKAVSMPSRYTAQMSIDDARDEAAALNVAFGVIPIEPAFEAFLGMLAKEFSGMPRDVTEENIQARCRGIVLMAISNKERRILLSTGNKSEMAVGYATLYGDMAGGFAPIKDVPKTLVYRLAQYRNTLGAVIPERVLTRPPSAELAPDQKDSDALPPYDLLDPILERYVELDQSVSDIVAAGFDPQLVRRVAGMVDSNEYKRRQAPPGVRISRRAFGRDRRYPITLGYGR